MHISHIYLEKVVFFLFVFVFTAVAKMIRTLVFSPAKNGLSRFCLSLAVCVSRKYQFTFTNIHFSINCNNPVRFLFAQRVWQQPKIWSTQRSDHHQSVWNNMKKQNKLRQTKSRRTVTTSPRCFKKPTCKAWKTICKCTEGKSYFKHKGGSHQMLI